MLPLEATGLVPAWGTKIPHALQEKKKKKKKRRKEERERRRKGKKVSHNLKFKEGCKI